MVDAPVGGHQVALLTHGAEVFAALIHRGPHGYHRLDAHGPQLLHHALGVGPFVGLKLVVALHGPVEKVNHDHVQGQATALVLPGHGKDFLLGAVAQLALPVAHAVFGHHGGAPCGGGILALNLRGGVPGGDEVVQLAGAAGLPLGDVGAEGGCADGGIVPQKAIAPAGHEERHAGLAVAVGQLQCGALLVQVPVLILAHAENLLIVVGLEAGGQLVGVAAHHMFHFPRGHPQGHTVAVHAVAGAPVFLGEHFSPLVAEADPALMVHMGGDLPVGQGGHLGSLMVLGPLLAPVPGVGDVDGLKGDGAVRFGDRLGERPVVRVHHGVGGHADAKAVFTPGLDPHLGVALGKDQSAAVLFHVHESFLLSWMTGVPHSRPLEPVPR